MEILFTNGTPMSSKELVPKVSVLPSLPRPSTSSLILAVLLKKLNGAHLKRMVFEADRDNTKLVNALNTLTKQVSSAEHYCSNHIAVMQYLSPKHFILAKMG